MQIHELTLRPKTNEGFLDTLKGAAKSAAATFNDPSALTNNTKFATTQANAKLAKATQGFVTKLAAEWPTVAKSIPVTDKTPPQAATRVAAQQQAPAKPQQPISIGGQKLDPNNPKDAALIAKLKPQQAVQEAFGDLPGAKPQPGAPVDPKLSAVPKPIAIATAQRNSSYAKYFEKWVADKTSTRESNSGKTVNLATVKQELPDLAKQLNTALTNVAKTKNNPDANQQAVTNYLTMAVQGIQQVASKYRRENPKSLYTVGKSSAPGQMDPQTAKMASAMNLSQQNLNKMKQVIDAQGEKVTQGTGSETIDNLLIAAGLLK